MLRYHRSVCKINVTKIHALCHERLIRAFQNTLPGLVQERIVFLRYLRCKQLQTRHIVGNDHLQFYAHKNAPRGCVFLHPRDPLGMCRGSIHPFHVHLKMHGQKSLPDESELYLHSFV